MDPAAYQAVLASLQQQQQQQQGGDAGYGFAHPESLQAALAGPAPGLVPGSWGAAPPPGAYGLEHGGGAVLTAASGGAAALAPSLTAAAGGAALGDGGGPSTDASLAVLAAPRPHAADVQPAGAAGPDDAAAGAGGAADVASAAAQEAELAAALAALGAEQLFCKTLTHSDANGQGRVVLPKANVEAHLPTLVDSGPLELAVLDSRGAPHKLRFRHWVNNASRMYLLEGTQPLQRQYVLGAGDVLVFARTREGQLVVAGRPGTSADPKRKAPARRLPDGIQSSRAAKRARRRRLEGDGGLGGGADSMEVLLREPGCEPIRDGVFRTLPEGVGAQPVPGVAAFRGGWAAVVLLAGQPYQAFFATEEAALDASAAAGSTFATAAPCQPAAA